MKYKSIIYGLAVVGLMIWALMEQASEHPRIWVQVIGVAVFFYAMAKLMQKTPSNTHNDSKNQFEPLNEEVVNDDDYSITVVNKKNK